MPPQVRRLVIKDEESTKRKKTSSEDDDSDIEIVKTKAVKREHNTSPTAIHANVEASSMASTTNSSDWTPPENAGQLFLTVEAHLRDYEDRILNGEAISGASQFEKFYIWLKDKNPRLVSDFKDKSRWKSIFSSEKWRNFLIEYCEYLHIRPHIKSFHAGNALACGLDEMWAKFIELDTKEMKDLFGTWARKIRSEDIKILHSIQSHINDPVVLRRLFFPKDSDINQEYPGFEEINEMLPVEEAWFAGAEFDSLRLDPPNLSAGDRKNECIRRPGFISLVSDDDFKSIYMSFISASKSESITLPVVGGRLKKYGPIVDVLGDVAKHIVFWANPEFPEAKNNIELGRDREKFSYFNMLVGAYPTGKLDGDARDEMISKVFRTLEDVLRYLQKNDREFQTVKERCKNLPRGESMGSDAMEEYQIMLKTGPWNEVLKIVVKHLGKEYFEPFIAEILDDNKPGGFPSKVLDLKRFFRSSIEKEMTALDENMPALCDYMSKCTAIATDKLQSQVRLRVLLTGYGDLNSVKKLLLSAGFDPEVEVLTSHHGALAEKFASWAKPAPVIQEHFKEWIQLLCNDLAKYDKSFLTENYDQLYKLLPPMPEGQLTPQDSLVPNDQFCI